MKVTTHHYCGWYGEVETVLPDWAYRGMILNVTCPECDGTGGVKLYNAPGFKRKLQPLHEYPTFTLTVGSTKQGDQLQCYIAAPDWEW